jgi:thiamine-phosphate pyrophosphorylase
MTDFPRPSLTLVTDRVLYRPREDKNGDPLSLVDAAIAGGVDIVQLRARTTSTDDLGLYAVALRLREMTEGKALFVVTGDVELAEKSRADGVLLPERSYKPSEARSFLRGVQPMPSASEETPHEHVRLGGGVRLVGAFARSVPAAGRAERGEADYVQIGPVFDETKDGPDDGLTLLRKVKDAVQIPVIAFGGVATPAHAADCLRAGADGVAVTDAILQAPDPQAAAVALRAALDAAWHVLHD